MMPKEANLLPFFAKKQVSQPIIEIEKQDFSQESEKDEYIQAIEVCAQDLIDAIYTQDVRRTAEVLKAAFEICDSRPHEEGPHTYEAQNAIAAKEQE